MDGQFFVTFLFQVNLRTKQQYRYKKNAKFIKDLSFLNLTYLVLITMAYQYGK